MGAKYCDQRVCMSLFFCLSVCLSVHLHISKAICLNFTKFSLHDTCGPCSVLLWWLAIRCVLAFLWIFYGWHHVLHNGANGLELKTTRFVQFARWRHRGKVCRLQRYYSGPRILKWFPDHAHFWVVVWPWWLCQNARSTQCIWKAIRSDLTQSRRAKDIGQQHPAVMKLLSSRVQLMQQDTEVVVATASETNGMHWSTAQKNTVAWIDQLLQHVISKVFTDERIEHTDVNISP